MAEILVSSPQKLVVGEGHLIEFALWTEVHARFRRGQGKRTMARELGLDRKTVNPLLGAVWEPPITPLGLSIAPRTRI